MDTTVRKSSTLAIRVSSALTRNTRLKLSTRKEKCYLRMVSSRRVSYEEAADDVAVDFDYEFIQSQPYFNENLPQDEESSVHIIRSTRATRPTRTRITGTTVCVKMDNPLL